MLNIGVVGDAHTVAFARLINVGKRIRGVRVNHVWGETASQARAAAADGQIPHIVKEPKDLIGVVDAALAAHVHGKYHLQAARPLLEAGMPLFIDKPFCCTRSEAKRFLAWQPNRGCQSAPIR